MIIVNDLITDVDIRTGHFIIKVDTEECEAVELLNKARKIIK